MRRSSLALCVPRFLDGVCSSLTGLEALIAPSHVGDHLLNQLGGSPNCLGEESSSSYRVQVVTGRGGESVVEALQD